MCFQGKYPLCFALDISIPNVFVCPFCGHPFQCWISIQIPMRSAQLIPIGTPGWSLCGVMFIDRYWSLYLTVYVFCVDGVCAPGYSSNLRTDMVKEQIRTITKWRNTVNTLYMYIWTKPAPDPIHIAISVQSNLIAARYFQLPITARPPSTPSMFVLPHTLNQISFPLRWYAQFC